MTISDNVLDVAKDFTALLIISDFDDILADLTTTYQNLSEPCMDALEYEGLLVIESTTSTEATQTRNKKLNKDPTLEAINRRREYARLGQEELDKKMVMKDGEKKTWLEVKDEVWPDREGCELHAKLKYPVYSDEEWFNELDKDDQERIIDMIAAERILYNEGPMFKIYRPNSMQIPGYFKHRPAFADVEYFIYRICRVFFITIWFYFFPIIVLILSYLLPLLTETEFFTVWLLPFIKLLGQEEGEEAS